MFYDKLTDAQLLEHLERMRKYFAELDQMYPDLTDADLNQMDEGEELSYEEMRKQLYSDLNDSFAEALHAARRRTLTLKVNEITYQVTYLAALEDIDDASNTP